MQRQSLYLSAGLCSNHLPNKENVITIVRIMRELSYPLIYSILDVFAHKILHFTPIIQLTKEIFSYKTQEQSIILERVLPYLTMVGMKLLFHICSWVTMLCQTLSYCPLFSAERN